MTQRRAQNLTHTDARPRTSESTPPLPRRAVNRGGLGPPVSVPMSPLPLRDLFASLFRRLGTIALPGSDAKHHHAALCAAEVVIALQQQSSRDHHPDKSAKAREEAGPRADGNPRIIPGYCSIQCLHDRPAPLRLGAWRPERASPSRRGLRMCILGSPQPPADARLSPRCGPGYGAPVLLN